MDILLFNTEVCKTCYDFCYIDDNSKLVVTETVDWNGN